MKYLYAILSITAMAVLPLMGAKLPGIAMEMPRAAVKAATEAPPVDPGPGRSRDGSGSGRPYGLHYNREENSWTLHATVLQLKKTSVYGRPGEIAQIGYSLDGQRLRTGWIVLRIDDFSFVDGTSQAAAIKAGQDVQLYISGVYVSASGVDWEKCPRDDAYCAQAGFVEGGFPKSGDYGGLTLCPSNSIIHSGFLPGSWLDGMLAWMIMGS